MEMKAQYENSVLGINLEPWPMPVPSTHSQALLDVLNKIGEARNRLEGDGFCYFSIWSTEILTW